MKASSFLKCSPMYDTVVIHRAVESTCARCGEYARHLDDCQELELEAQARLESALQASVELMSRSGGKA